MHPSCLGSLLFVDRLSVLFFYSVSPEQNLIRAEGIQINVRPPNAIWFPNKGFGEKRKELQMCFRELERELLEERESFNKLM